MKGLNNPRYTVYRDIINGIKDKLRKHLEDEEVPFDSIIADTIEEHVKEVGMNFCGMGEAKAGCMVNPITSVEEYLAKFALQDIINHTLMVRAQNHFLLKKTTFTAQDAIDRIDFILKKTFTDEERDRIARTIISMEMIETLGQIVLDNISPGLGDEYKKALQAIKENLNTNLV